MKNISRLRTAVSKKYLDWAEKLPVFKGGGIHSLQITREFDRKEATDQRERTRPPKGASIEFPYFRAMEIFTIEEFDKLQSGLLRLFPQLSDRLIGRDFVSEFGRRAESIKGGSWQHIGYIFRDANKRFLGLDAYREMNDLPEVVEWIKVELHRFLPSLSVVTLDVNLTDEATAQLNSVQQGNYLPEVEFRSLLPWKAWRGAVSTSSSELQRRSVFDWCDNLRQSVERCFAPFIGGYFLNNHSRRRARLPSVDCLILKGAPQEEDDFGKWLKDARGWLDSYGLRLTYRAFQSEDAFFVPTTGKERSHQIEQQDRLLILWDAAVKTVSVNGHGGDQRRAIVHDSQSEIMNSLNVRVAMLQFLGSIERQVKSLRTITFKTMASKRRLGNYLKLYHRILRASLLLDRTALEFPEQKWLVEHDLENLQSFCEVHPRRTRDQGDNLAARTIKEIEWNIDLLSKHLSHVRSVFSEFVAQQNLRISYRLQWIVLWLSAIATVAAVIGVLAGWASIKEFLKDVLGIQF